MVSKLRIIWKQIVLQPPAVIRFGEVEPEDKGVPLAPALRIGELRARDAGFADGTDFPYQTSRYFNHARLIFTYILIISMRALHGKL